MEGQDGVPKKLLTGTTLEIQWQGISTLLLGQICTSAGQGAKYS